MKTKKTPRRKRVTGIKIKGGKFLERALKGHQQRLKKAVEDALAQVASQRQRQLEAYTVRDRPVFQVGDRQQVTLDGHTITMRVMAIRLSYDGTYRIELEPFVG